MADGLGLDQEAVVTEDRLDHVQTGAAGQQVGQHFGSEDRMDYTIIGGGVNLAARLENACPPSEILLSYETYSHVKDQIKCHAEGQIKAKGISEPISTFRVIDLYDNLADDQQSIRSQTKHMNLNVDINLMTPEEQQEALRTLQEAAERLAHISEK